MAVGLIYVAFICISSSAFINGQFPPGHIRPINRSDPGVYISANAAADELNQFRGYNDAEPRLVLMEVINGTEQVVDGQEYRLDIALGESTCKNTEQNAHATATDCPLVPKEQPVMMCLVKVLYQHWFDNKTSVQSTFCSDNPHPTPPPRGGQQIINRSDPHVYEAAQQAINVINKDAGYSDNIKRQSLGPVVNGTVQVVDGDIYRLIFKIGTSVCVNSLLNADATTAECPFNTSEPVQFRECDAEIVYKHLATPEYTIMHTECEFDRLRRQVPPGGQKLINRTDPHVYESAQQAVNAINEDAGYSDNIKRQSLGPVINGTVQEADGSIYRLIFDIATSVCVNSRLNADATTEECPFNKTLPVQFRECNAEIIYKGWTNPNPEFTVLRRECEFR